MTIPWSFCMPVCLLCQLLALNTHTAHSAPDFSGKCVLTFLIPLVRRSNKKNADLSHFGSADVEKEALERHSTLFPRLSFAHPAFQTAGTAHAERPESG